MISKRGKMNAVVQGQITIPLEPLIEDVLIFLNQYLPLYPSSIIKAGEHIITEKLLNQQLTDFFNGHSPDHNGYLHYRFIFRKDDERADTHFRPDIGVTLWHKELKISDHNSFFQIECKRLPITNLSQQRSEKEYVIGTKTHKGGIERFKTKEHGHHLDQAAIIGYVQANSIDFWFNKINEWIEIEISNSKTLIWTKKDHLTLEYKKEELSKYNSTCGRTDGEDIILHHFLLKMA